MTRRTLHRPGVTLTEVLVAMFVMAIGMISLLTLFPLGAMQVGQALRDDRCRQTALQADAYMRSHWRHQVVEKLNRNDLLDPVIEPYFWAMDDVNLYVTPSALANPKAPGSGVFLNSFVTSTPNYQLPNGINLPRTATGSAVSPNMLTGDLYRAPAGPPVLPNPVGPTAYAFAGSPNANPSYPVFIDLLGEFPRSGFDKLWTAGSQFSSVSVVPNFLLLPRRQLNVATTSGLALQIAGMTDDLSFAKNGAPEILPGPPVFTPLGRQGRYTWSAIVQRPRNDVRTIANLTILVFDGRSSLPTTGDEQVVNPVIPQNILDRTVTIVVPARTSVDQPVLLRKGGWIMDGNLSTSPLPGQVVNFYRVTGFVEGATTAAGTSYEVDLETPLKYALTTSSQLYLFAGLAEVFERPTLKPDSGYYIP